MASNASLNPYRQAEQAHSARSNQIEAKYQTDFEATAHAYEKSTQDSKFHEKLNERAKEIWDSVQDTRSASGHIPLQVQQLGITSPELYNYISRMENTPDAINAIKTFIDPSRLDLPNCIQGSNYLDFAARKDQQLKEEIALSGTQDSSHTPLAKIGGFLGLQGAREPQNSRILNAKEKNLQRTISRSLRDSQSEQRKVLYNFRNASHEGSSYAHVMRSNKSLKQVHEAEVKYNGSMAPSSRLSGVLHDLKSKAYSDKNNSYQQAQQDKEHISADYLAVQTIASHSHSPGSIPIQQLNVAQEQLGIQKYPGRPNASVYIGDSRESSQFIGSLEQGKVPWLQLQNMSGHLAQLASQKNPDIVINPRHIRGAAEEGLGIAVEMLESKGAHTEVQELIRHAKSQGLEYEAKDFTETLVTPSLRSIGSSSLPRASQNTALSENNTLEKKVGDWESSLGRFLERNKAEAGVSQAILDKAANKIAGRSLAELERVKSGTQDETLKEVIELAIYKAVDQRLSSYIQTQGQAYNEQQTIDFFLHSPASHDLDSILAQAMNEPNKGALVDFLTKARAQKAGMN